MRLGELLVGRGIATVDTICTALNHQRRTGATLGAVLVWMGVVTEDQLTTLMASIDAETPKQPRTMAETGIADGQLVNLMLKFMLLESREAISDLSRAMRLTFQVVQDLMGQAIQRQLVQAMGARAISGAFSDIRYTLTQEGRAAANDAVRQNQYVGPAPVPLALYREQIQKQRIANEFISADRLRSGLGGLQVPEHYIRKLLPAINSGRTILLFGPSGNGKTTVANRIARLFTDVIHIPYAVDIDGHIMTVFDRTLHEPVVAEDDRRSLEALELAGDMFDDRWVACRRPFAMAGGELTLETLEMKYDPDAGFYDAPPHVKVLNGVFLIDDFGRQQVPPSAILNRWIVPMENQIDFQRLHTGKTFSLPFDQLLIFSTNIDPRDIVDAALLRRIPYKVLLYGPNETEYRRLFHKEAEEHGLTLDEAVLDQVIDLLSVRGEFGLAYFQAKFVCGQAVEICRSFDIPMVLTKALAVEALSNLYVQIESDPETHADDAPKAAGEATGTYTDPALAVLAAD